MSWLNTSIANLAKNALKEAQKTIDKALDIRDTDASQTQDLIEEPFNNPDEEQSTLNISNCILLSEVVLREPISNSGTDEEPGVLAQDNSNGCRNNLTEEKYFEVGSSNLDDPTSPENVNCLSSSSVSRISTPENFHVDIEWKNSSTSTIRNENHHVDYHQNVGQKEVLSLLSEAMKDSIKADVSTSASGDEVETTTSSDIEIIASPQAGIRKILSPHDTTEFSQLSKHSREPSEASSDSSMISTRGSLKSDAAESKILQLNELLVARDNQQYELARKCSFLSEEVDRLNELLTIREKEIRGAGETLRKQSEDFALRFSSIEKRYQQAIAERDALNLKFDYLKKKPIPTESLAGILKEKEETIEQLQFEGEKLSKNLLKQSNIIKKLREKEKEEENRIKQLRKLNEELGNQVEQLKKSLSIKEEMERNQSEAIKDLTVSNDQLGMELASVKVMLRQKISESESLKTALTEAEKALLDVKTNSAIQDSAETERSLSAEISLRQRLQHEFESSNLLFEQEKEALSRQCQELAESLADIQTQHSREKERLQNELSQVMHRLQESEYRSDELSQALASATRPLLRQIETLQQTILSQRIAEENSVKVLKDRLVVIENQLLLAQRNETADQDKCVKMQTKIEEVEAILLNKNQENQRLLEELNLEKHRLETLKETTNRENLKSELLKSQLVEDLKRLEQKVNVLENDLGRQTLFLEEERKKTLYLTVRLQEKELEHNVFITDLNNSNTITNKSSLEVISRSSSPTPSLGKLSLSGSFSESHSSNPWNTTDEVFEGGPSTPVPKATLYETMRAGSYTAIFESLQAQLKTRDGEVVQLQHELEKQGKSRDSLVKELTEITKSNQELRSRLDSLESVRNECDDMTTKYNALLQMYGEKIEENEELRLDLEDIKEMYKAQIDQLVKM